MQARVVEDCAPHACNVRTLNFCMAAIRLVSCDCWYSHEMAALANGFRLSCLFDVIKSRMIWFVSSRRTMVSLCESLGPKRFSCHSLISPGTHRRALHQHPFSAGRCCSFSDSLLPRQPLLSQRPAQVLDHDSSLFGSSPNAASAPRSALPFHLCCPSLLPRRVVYCRLRTKAAALSALRNSSRCSRPSRTR